MDVSQYLEIFVDETKEHLQSLNEQILILEKEPENVETINEIFRAAHSLKGMAGTMGYKRMQHLTHDMENVFTEVRNTKIKVTPELIDVVFQCLDALEVYLANIQSTSDEGTEDNSHINKQLNNILNETDVKAGTTKPEVKEAKKEEDNSDMMKFKYIELADFEKSAVAKAKEQNKNCFGATIYVQESCLLKAARAFLVFKALEEMGDIIKSSPPVQDIEDEKFDLYFSILLVTDEGIDKVKEAILKVSEIQSVYAEPYELTGVEYKQIIAAEAANTTNKTEVTGTTSKSADAPVAKSAKPVVTRSVRVDIEKLDVLMNLVSELIIAKNGLSAISGDGSKNSGFNEQIEYLERVTTNLHESVMKVRMVPIESVVAKFPRMIRDLSKKLNKKMDLFMSGEDTELDRTVIDEIGDPLNHLLRNSADHGLETPEKRKEVGKPEVGSIFLDAYQEGNNVVIEVRDDGAGINVDIVRSKAIEKGSITEEQSETMTDKDIIDLLFKPSFSTAAVVSDVSGRGVGLDVVKTKIESLGGDIEVKTELGKGTNFIIRLPLTLAIIQALMVELGEEKYAIPLGSIQTIEDIEIADIKYVQTREVINLRGAVIPLIRLDAILDVPKKEEEQTSLTVVIITKGDKQAGLVVDNLIGQQEIVIKPLGKYININRIIGGATILGDGEVALILDVNTLV